MDTQISKAKHLDGIDFRCYYKIAEKGKKQSQRHKNVKKLLQMTTGLVYHPDYLKHDLRIHPENADRLRSIIKVLEEKKLMEKLVSISPRRATVEELEYVHRSNYIHKVDSLCREGKGTGYNMNFPLPSGSTGKDYLDIFSGILLPRVREFVPEIIFISAGFDGHKDDPLGGMDLTEEDFRKFTSLIKDVAEDVCQGRIVSALEGGYNLPALSQCVLAHLQALR